MGAEELAERRRRAEAARAERLRIERFRTVYRAIDARHPLSAITAHVLLAELAGVQGQLSSRPKALYRAAAARWHPDLENGDEEVFKLLQEVYRVVRPVSA
ncbi:J domain-containing protein [Streptomyces sp. NPDC015350]|uniref:J domain-containing protein n=1 Tax=Streptomyces sp. NPDC015350 TaxID=3364955 RepID=UPI0036F8777D